MSFLRLYNHIIIPWKILQGSWYKKLINLSKFSLSLRTVFDVILSNIDEVLLINPSANAFAFGEFNFLDLFIYSDACICSSVTIGKFWSYCCLIWKMFPGRISLNKVLVLNSGSRSRLEMMYISLILNIRSSFIYPHDFQLLVLLPWLI